MIFENTCSNPSCFGPKVSGNTLCRKCLDLRESAIVIGICFGMCAFIVALAKIGRMI